MPQMLRMVSFTPKVHRLRTYQRAPTPTIELSVAELEPINDGPGAAMHPLRSGFREPTMELDISDGDVMVMGNTLVYCLLAPSPPPVPKRAALRLTPPPASLGRSGAKKGRWKLSLVGAQPIKELEMERMAMPYWVYAAHH